MGRVSQVRLVDYLLLALLRVVEKKQPPAGRLTITQIAALEFCEQEGALLL